MLKTNSEQTFLVQASCYVRAMRHNAEPQGTGDTEAHDSRPTHDMDDSVPGCGRSGAGTGDTEARDSRPAHDTDDSVPACGRSGAGTGDTEARRLTPHKRQRASLRMLGATAQLRGAPSPLLYLHVP